MQAHNTGWKNQNRRCTCLLNVDIVKKNLSGMQGGNIIALRHVQNRGGLRCNEVIMQGKRIRRMKQISNQLWDKIINLIINLIMEQDKE
jgi:hypothetical protein